MSSVNCYVCGHLSIFGTGPTSLDNSVLPPSFTVRGGRTVCADVAACTERVMRPPPMWHEEFITDEQIVRHYRPAGNNPHTIISRMLEAHRPELRGAEIQVMRDKIRCGWKVRAKR